MSLVIEISEKILHLQLILALIPGAIMQKTVNSELSSGTISIHTCHIFLISIWDFNHFFQAQSQSIILRDKRFTNKGQFVGHV